MTGRYYVHTMGCQMNERDSETLSGILRQLGYQPASALEEADVILLNTCAVREKPERKVLSLLADLAPLKRRRPELIVGVCGCVAQVQAEALRSAPVPVDLILGPRNYDQLPRLIAEAPGHGGLPQAALQEDRCLPEALPTARNSQITAYVNITYGCSNYCAYCVVPYARGPLQSRSPVAILDEVRGLVDAGYRQITLLGQNVNAYGQDLAESIDFPDLLYKVDQLCTGLRVRFTTSHPKDCSPRVLEAIRDLPSVCEWLHLPLQAGDDLVLAEMGRGYSVQEYLDIVAHARELIPDLALTTDVMVGFPGETEAQFENTYRLMEQIRFDQAFTFKFSPRPQTQAAGRSDQVPESAKQTRLSRLAEMVARVSREVNRERIGHSFEVLIEGPDPKRAECMRGRTRHNKLFILPGGRELAGQLVWAQAEEAYLWGFRGTQTAPLAAR